MFTGIIEEIGKIQGIQKGTSSAILSVQASEIMEDVYLGDSIAVNGVCLTVTSISPNGFTADVMHETLNRSSLGNLRIGNPVNLERAMPANGRFGGHIITGHIDGTGTILDIRRDDNSLWYIIKTPLLIIRYIIEKGSIAIDGISLTVARVYKDSFSVSIIPHTASSTTLSSRRVGDLVNLENDCIGKYVECLMGKESQNNNITAEFLTKYGF
ncbi:riboflavin synthase [Irregularibacter muris]|uniref:Riboflavin synthase n=1 Tax=Irregularibacter muris TaxID=1796619 RepID=A0AAE3HGV8_9FIRM|nr:riboflavin synthase [Irregularibacter muris]MCR1899951.1 riboflavin synthase [Irregularibacter muris]